MVARPKKSAMISLSEAMKLLQAAVEMHQADPTVEERNAAREFVTDAIKVVEKAHRLQHPRLREGRRSAEEDLRKQIADLKERGYGRVSNEEAQLAMSRNIKPVYVAMLVWIPFWFIALRRSQRTPPKLEKVNAFRDDPVKRSALVARWRLAGMPNAQKPKR